MNTDEVQREEAKHREWKGRARRRGVCDLRDPLFDDDVLPRTCWCSAPVPSNSMAQAYRRLGAEVTVIGEQLPARGAQGARALYAAGTCSRGM